MNFIKSTGNKAAYYYALIMVQLLSLKAAHAQTGNALDTMAEGLEEDILDGDWRKVLVAVFLMFLGFIFCVGKMAWYWVAAIVIGVGLIAGATNFSDWLFGLFEA